MNRNFHRNQNKYVAHLDMMFFETGKLFIFNLRKLDLLQKKLDKHDINRGSQQKHIFDVCLDHPL